VPVSTAIMIQRGTAMEFSLAAIEDAEQILKLQTLAYQSEAEIYQDYNIPPLTQTIAEIKEEFVNQTFLKAVDGKNIIGSVRAYSDGNSCFIGRLIVHPDSQGKGIGTRLMNAIEAHFPDAQRCELFTGTKSIANIRLYDRLGYRPFKELVVNESLSLVFMEKVRKLTT
jgi:ribosomal protein S18 acetylase RimI-like enzyme